MFKIDIKKTIEIRKISITPIIDVALVLVIILLITAPVLSVSDLKVALPEVSSRGIEDENRISITISKEGKFTLDRRSFAGKTLTAVLEKELEKKEGSLVIIRADSHLPYREIRRVLEEARAAGARRLAIATVQSAGVPLEETEFWGER